MAQLEDKAADSGESSRAVVSLLPRGSTVLPPSIFSLKYLLDGEEVYESGSGSQTIRSGQMLIAPARQAFTVALRRPSAGLCLYFNLPLSTFREIPTLRLNASELALGRTIEQMATEALHAPSVDMQARLQGVRQSIEDTLVEVAGFARKVGGVRSRTRRQRLESLMAGRLYLENNGFRPVTLEEAARAAGISAFHFSRQFSEVFGVSPVAYHEQVRLNHAKRLLEAGSSPTCVARDLGYSELSAFSRSFRKRYGGPPSAVRPR